MTYYQKHLFFCTNLRENGKACCELAGASSLYDYTKKKLKELGLSGRGQIRVSKAGCLGRCDLGPLLVVYPEAVWYTYKTQEDIDEIIEQYVVRGQHVKRLLLKD